MYQYVCMGLCIFFHLTWFICFNELFLKFNWKRKANDVCKNAQRKKNKKNASKLVKLKQQHIGVKCFSSRKEAVNFDNNRKRICHGSQRLKETETGHKAELNYRQ